MAAPSQRRRVLARAGQLEYDRVLYFSDAVFAIAITLLIVDLRVPDVDDLQSGQQLRDTVPQIGGFALSFAVIGLFWTGHHRLFRHVKGLNGDPDTAQLAVPGLHRVPALSDRPAQRGRRPGAGNDLLRRHHRRRRAGRGRVVAVRDPHPRSGPPRHLALGAPLGAAANPPGPGGVPAVDPGCNHRPDLAKSCGCWSSSVGWRCAGWNQPTRSRRPPTSSAPEFGAPRSSGDDEALPCPAAALHLTYRREAHPNRRPSDYESKSLRPADAVQTGSGCSRQRGRLLSAFLTCRVMAGGMTRPTHGDPPNQGDLPIPSGRS